MQATSQFEQSDGKAQAEFFLSDRLGHKSGACVPRVSVVGGVHTLESKGHGCMSNSFFENVAFRRRIGISETGLPLVGSQLQYEFCAHRCWWFEVERVRLSTLSARRMAKEKISANTTMHCFNC